jgi:hypothetical protein
LALEVLQERLSINILNEYHTKALQSRIYR